ncbi:MAG: hypothetical protein COA99_10460 [Moraxellaceae bacterium]|nr:MAG: hypothetical protein COA99_10460 [Moraxellaceae bacterium]
MSDYIETLWAQFFIESEEHFDLIEPILVEAEFNVPQREDIDQLFRSFHSIKGLSKAMDLLGMETLSHHAEDLLGLVRDGVIAMDSALADALLTAVDALKHHLQFAAETRTDQPPAEELILRLEKMFSSANGAVEKATVEDDIIDDQTRLSDSADSADPAEPDQNCSGVHSDPEMLKFYAELLSSELPKLTGLLTEEFDAESVATTDLLGDIETLVHATTTMEFTQLAESFSSIVDLLTNKESITESIHEKFVTQLMNIVELARIVEQEVKQECGISPLVAKLQACTVNMIEGLFQELAEQLLKISTSSENNISTDMPELVTLAIDTAEKASVLNNYLRILDASDTSKQLLLTVAEACNHINHGQAVPESDLIKLLINAVSIAQSECGLVDGSNDKTSISVDWNDLHENIWDAIKQKNCSVDDETTISFKDLTKKIDINPIFEDCMSVENIVHIQGALEESKIIYEALVNLEESEEFTLAFLQWVDSDVELVTNSTVFVDGKPWSDCLLLTEHSEGEMRNAMKQMDPEHKYIKLVVCLRHVEEKKVVVSATTNAPAKDMSMLRVSGAALDQFMSQIGEMVSIRGMLSHTIHYDGVNVAITALKKMANEIISTDFNNECFLENLGVLEQQFKSFDQVDEKLHAVLSQLQDSALALRVVPMETVFKRFPRSVRDLAKAQGKQVKLELLGQDVRIDKAMVDVLSDPLMHMVRNSVDHGIELPADRLAAGKPEQACVSLEARQQGNSVKVTITDDGCGINIDAVKAKALKNGLASAEALQKMNQQELMQFIFAPGFSTAEKITETSGRGVGMDVVRTNVMKMGGEVMVHSELGKGSCFTLVLPLSAAIQDTVLVRSSGQLMAIPERYVSEMIEIRRADVQWVKGYQAIVLRERFLPVYRLGPLLGYQGGQDSTEESLVVAVLSVGKQRIGVIIGSSYQRQELFIKDTHKQLTDLPGVGGASILGDGRVVLILEVEDLFSLASDIGKTALLELNTDISGVAQCVGSDEVDAA